MCLGITGLLIEISFPNSLLILMEFGRVFEVIYLVAHRLKRTLSSGYVTNGKYILQFSLLY